MTDGRILGHEAVGTVEAVGSAVTTVTAGRPGAGVLHHRVRPLPVLPRGQLRPVPRRRRLDPRPHDRRHPGRVRAGAVRRHLDLPAPRRRRRRSRADARRHPADRLRGRRAQRQRPARATSSRSSAPARSGSSAIMGARLFSPRHIVAIDLADTRLDAAKHVRRRRRRQPDGREDPLGRSSRGSPTGSAPTSSSRRSASRTPSSCAPRLVRPGGHVANIGVHGKPATLAPGGPLDQERHHHHRARRHLLDPSLMRLLASGQLDAHRFVTHRFALDDIPAAYGCSPRTGR